MDLRIEWVSGRLFRLINSGDAPAVNISCVTPHELVRGLQDPFDMDARDAYEFHVVTAMGTQTPTSLAFTWDGQDEPVRLLLPVI
ncbi:hypothetical protein AB0H51_11480 [Streptomyces griseoluteus]|uniref:hypothetical protein n=1 Tax=Streptomyces griseoluteus TaxID=29306 RepID=UPI00340C410A